jgi:hypothetical protein
MTGTDALSLDSISLLLVWTAIVTYLLAFIAYTIDLAGRSIPASTPQREPALVGATATVSPQNAGAQSGGTDSVRTSPAPTPRLLGARIGTSLAFLAFWPHLAGTILRGVAAGRVPWANRYEFALTGAVLIVAVYLLVLRRYDLRFLGSFLIGTVLLLGGATIIFYVEVVPLMDPLKSVWLVIHVLVASLATALFAIACGLAVTQLMQTRRERRTDTNLGPCRRPAVPGDAAYRGCARVPRVPVCDRRVRVLDIHPDRWCGLGKRFLETLLGIRHQGSVDLRDLGALRRVHPRPRDQRMARPSLRLAMHHRVPHGDIQLHRREHVLQRTPHLLRPQLSLPRESARDPN